MPSFLLLVGIVMIAFSLKSVRAESFGLVVQDVEISPVVAKIGEPVGIGVTIKNIRKNTTSCNVTVFCGDCVVEEVQEIMVDSQTSVPLFFELNTSLMSAGVYSIGILVEETSGQEKISDLGTITIESEPSSTSPAYSALPYLLPVVPAGAAASILVKRKRSNKSQDPVVPKRQNACMPHILNEILKFEEKVETEISDDKKYIC